MNNEIKVLLTITLEGGTLHRSEKEEKKEFVITKKDISPNTKFQKGEGNKVVRKGKYTEKALIVVPATLTTKICREAYDYMTSTETPEWFMPYKPTKERAKIWRKFDTESRLKYHLARICDHHRGKSFSYSIVED